MNQLKKIFLFQCFLQWQEKNSQVQKGGPAHAPSNSRHQSGNTVRAPPPRMSMLGRTACRRPCKILPGKAEFSSNSRDAPTLEFGAWEAPRPFARLSQTIALTCDISPLSGSSAPGAYFQS